MLRLCLRRVASRPLVNLTTKTPIKPLTNAFITRSRLFPFLLQKSLYTTETGYVARDDISAEREELPSERFNKSLNEMLSSCLQKISPDAQKQEFLSVFISTFLEQWKEELSLKQFQKLTNTLFALLEGLVSQEDILSQLYKIIKAQPKPQLYIKYFLKKTQKEEQDGSIKHLQLNLTKEDYEDMIILLQYSNEARPLLILWKHASNQRIKFSISAIKNSFRILRVSLNPALFVEAFEMMKVSLTYPSDLRFAYHLFLHMIIGKLSVETRKKYIEEMKSKFGEFTRRDHEYLLSHYATNIQLNDMISVYNEMKEKKLQISTETFDRIISAFSMALESQEVVHYFNEMISQGLKPTVKTYSNLIRVFLLLDNKEKAEQILERMLKEPLKDVSDYEDMFLALGLLEKYDVLVSTFEEMKSKKIKPSLRVYSLLFRYVGLDQDLSKTIETFESMRKSGIPTTMAMYRDLLVAISKSKQLDLLQHYLGEMQEDKHGAIIGTYTLLVNAFAEQGDHKQVEEIVNLVKSLEIHPDIYFYNSLIFIYARIFDIVAVQNYYKQMLKDNVQPTIRTWTGLLFAYGRVQNFDLLEETFEQFRKTGLKPDTIFYDVYARAYFGDQVKLEQIFWDMKKENVAVDEILAELFLNATRNVTIRNQIAKELRESGVYPDSMELVKRRPIGIDIDIPL